MYRGNMPNQFNGSGVPQGQEYNNPGFNPSSMAPGQPQNHVQMRQGQVRGHPNEIQHFPNPSPRYAPSPAQLQAQYRNPQPGGYPYGYNSNKMMPTSQSYQSSISNPTQPGHMYVSTMPGQVRGPGGYSGSVQELPTVSEMRASKVAPGEIGMLQSYSSQPDSAGMYNGQPYMGRMVGSGNAQQMTAEQMQSMQGIPHQNLSQQPQGNQSFEPVPSYSQQQHSSLSSQFQQGMAPSSGSSAMYRHPQYQGPSPQSQRVPSHGSQFEETPQQKALRHQQQIAQQQPQMNQQAQMQGGQMKSFMAQQYRGRTPTPSVQQMQSQQQNNEMIGVPGHPLQQAMSPRHNSPLSPMRAVRQTVPPVSPQVPNPQFTAPQESPHNVPRPVSPSPRMPSYSPKLMQPGQPYMNPGPPITPSRTPTPRGDTRGFMSPPRMMSPPPNSQHSIGMQRMQQSPYNGDALTPQHPGYYSSAARYPHGAWPGGRQPTPSKIGTVPMQQLPMQGQQAAMQKQQRYPQQPQMYGNMMGQVSAPNKPLYRAPPTSIQPQRMLTPENGPGAAPRTMAPIQGPDFGNDFNLDSLLGDPADSSGSFMQQLQEISPANNDVANSQPPANSQVLEPGQIPPDLMKPVPAPVNAVPPGNLAPNTLVSPTPDSVNTSHLSSSSKTDNEAPQTPPDSKSAPDGEPPMEPMLATPPPSGELTSPVVTAATVSASAVTMTTTTAAAPMTESVSNQEPKLEPVQRGAPDAVSTGPGSLPNQASAVGHISSHGQIPGQVPPQGQISGQVAPQGQISGQSPSQGQIQGQPPSQGQMAGQAPSQGQMPGQTPSQGQMPGQVPGQGQIQGQPPGQGQIQGQPPGQGQMPGHAPSQGQMPGQVSSQGHPPGQGQIQGQPPGQGQMPGQVSSQGQIQGQAPAQGQMYRPGMGPGMQGHPRTMQLRPTGPGGPGGYQGPYRQMHPHQMQGIPQPGQPGAPPSSQGPNMHPHDGRGVYPQMHGYPPRHMHPQYGYGPHPQASAAPYPPGAGPRPPFSQAGPHMPGGAPMRHGYMGPRGPYPGGPHMHPTQQQHLQQRLQGLRHEAQKLQAQLQRAQLEENQAKEQTDPPTEMTSPPTPSPRVEQMRGRLMEVDHNIRHIMSQLQHASVQQDPNAPMGLQAPPGYQPHDSVSPGKPGEDPMTPGGKKKRPRKPKTPKAPKEEGEEGSRKEKPPKKKKKRELEGEDGEKKKKKKAKKLEKMNLPFPADNELSMDGDSKSLSADIEEEVSRGSENNFEPDLANLEEDDSAKDLELIKKKSAEKKKRKPPATLVKTKKKRKRGYDSSDEMNSQDILPSTPPELPDESLIEKRRSGRNVKRKRYIEAIEYQFSGEEESDSAVKGEKQTSQQIVEMNDAGDDDEVMIVDKILSHRVRKKKARTTSESREEKILENGQDPVHAPSTAAPPETPTPLNTSGEVPAGEHTPILSPTSLKNPRIRRLSMGVVGEEQEENEEEEEGIGEDEFYVKYKNYSYLHCEWKLKSEIEDKRFDQKLKRYATKNSINGQLIYPDIEEDEIFNPDFVEVDRVLDVMLNEDREDGQVTRHFLCKWCSLAYEDSTWEREEDINTAKILQFEGRCRYRPPMKRVCRPHKENWHRMTEDNTRFKNNNLLRDYQFEGINWLMFNWYNRRNCILADEMGLGKTIQSITFLQKIFDHGIQGPFLIVAPLSTIANWLREFESWTSINAVVYHGSQTSRDMLYTYEWFCRDKNLDEIKGSYKMHAVITTYEMIVLDSAHLKEVDWRCLIIDEAHRLKNLSCKLVESLRSMQLEHKVLLTGTPLQNNVEELFALLSFLQPDTFNCQQAFSIEFGNLKDSTQVQKLQELLKPMMLRRLKEDVEKSLAPKQETIIEVELTDMQKKYYRAILERNFEFLAKGTVSGNVPNLMNAMMELRKCCNHPYLIKGAEDKIITEHKDSFKEFNPLIAMVQSSGKLVLIDKLLPRLKEGGHKVLVFSQMVRVLDILEDYLVQKSFLYERIDGSIRGNERQMAIDRFSRKGSDRFVFLLCTRAGGLGINLTAADTVIIFDSDWNPQNDLQAQARCHRIGQQKPVKIYRLITRNSYEREMFDKASLKLGLDKAVLQSISGRQDQTTQQSQGPQLSKHEVEDLLKRGAYGAIMDDDDAASKFCEEDIDQILERRAHTVTLESGEKGSSFSKASFVSTEDRSDISLDDPNFWEKWAKKADLDLERLKDNKLIIEIPRNRKQTRRFGGNPDETEIFGDIGSDSDDSEYESGDEEGTGRGRKSKFRSRAGGMGGGQRKGWGRRDCFRIEKCLLNFGWGRWSVVQTRGRFSELISEKELEDMSRAVLMFCLRYYNGDEKIKYFMWDLITPTEHAAGIDLRNHEGLAAPVPRGRKGKRAKEDPETREEEQGRREWARGVDLDALLPDEGFRKHIQHQCNKVLLRVRMLYYLRTEILGSILPVIDNRYETLELDMIDKLSDPPAIWWDQDCDKCLMVGVYKYGYEKYSMMRADPLLCFLERAGPPDERLLSAEMNVEPEDTDADPEYKPTRVTFNEQEFSDSPAPGTPSTDPASPASTDNSKPKKDDADLIIETKRVVKPVELGRDWPSISELNTRLRKLVAYYQKQHKHMQQRLMNLDRRGGRQRYSDGGRLDVRRNVHQTRWTRREEADFYRTVSTFGIERDHRSGEFLWQRFRNIARLDRKSDDSLRLYYFAFRAMCEKVCRWKGEPGTSDGTGVGLHEEIPNIDVDHITEERASRTLYRIRLLDKIRCEVLSHPKIKERLALCQRSPELPIWWKNGVHDKELLIAMDRHGVTRTEIHTLNDPKLSFLSSMREYDSDPNTFKQQVMEEEKAEFDKLVQLMKEHEEAAAALKKEEEKLKKLEEKNKNEDKEKEAGIDEAKQKVDEPESKVTESEQTKVDEADRKVDQAEPKVEEPKENKPEEDPKTPPKSPEDVKKSPVPMETGCENGEDVVAAIPERSEIVTEVLGGVKSKEVVPDAKEEAEEVKKEEDPVVKSPEKMEVEAPPVKEEEEKSSEEQRVKEEDQKEEKVEKKEVKTEIKEEVKEEKDDITKGMSLRSKNAVPPLSQDLINALASSHGQFGHMAPYMVQSMNGRWPKDRILIQRVENICFCILNGEWPSILQTSSQSGLSGPGTPQSGNYGSRSQTPISFADGRGTPVNTGSQNASAVPAVPDLNLLNVNDPQLQAAVAQLLAQATPDTSGRGHSYSGSKRGRRKKRPEQILPQSASQNFNNLNVPMDKSLQRKIEQLMAANNSTFAHLPSSTASLFSSQGVGDDKFSLSSKEKEDSGNSSASLLANLRELAQAESKSSEPHSSRGRPRSSGGRSRHQHSPSPSQPRSKDKLGSDLLKHAGPFMPSPEQILSMNPALQQAMQDAMKAGIDPMTAAAAFLPLFPMLDPFQMMQGGLKPENVPQLPPQINLPSPAEMEKLLKGMGLPPELAFSAGLLPGGMMMPPGGGGAMPAASSSKSERRRSPKPPKEDKSSSSEKKESILGSLEKRTPQKKGSKLDAMFGGGGKDEGSPGRLNKKPRKSKFVSPAMLPGDTRIPVHNSTEGLRFSGGDAPLNRDLADWLKENPGFVVDYQALRQQLDEGGSKKLSETSDSAGITDTSGQEGDILTSPKKSPKPKEQKSKDEMLEEADLLLKNAEKLVQNTKNQDLDDERPAKTPDKSRQSDFALPKPLPSPSPSSNRGSTPHGASGMSKQQLTELAMMQMAGMSSLPDPTTAAMFGLPPDILNNLANLPPDIAALMAGGFLPGGVSPDLLASLKAPRDDKSGPESPSSTPSRASPSQRHARSHNYDTTPPRDHNLLTGDERVPLINITSGKKVTGKQAPELQTLADYLRIYQDVVIAPEWTNVLKKSKFLPKELHNRLIPTSQPTASKSSSASAAAQSNAALAALSGMPPNMAAAMFPGLMQGQNPFMPDPMQLMAALQQGQGQIPDMKTLAASGFPMLPLFGAGMPNPLLPPGFGGGDPATMAAMATLSSQAPTSSGSSEKSQRSHDRGRESSGANNSGGGERSRKSKKYSEKSDRPPSTSSASMKSFGADPMVEALAALQRSGGLQGMANPFLGAGANPMMFPPMMMGAGQGLQFPMDMMNPELLAAQMAALGSMPGLDPSLLKAPSASQSAPTTSNGGKREQRRGSTSSSSSKKEHHSTNSGNRPSGTDEQPMDLTSFSGGESR